MKNAFVFPGQGSQFVGMGKDLAENFASAREVFQEVDNTLNQNLFALMTGGPEHELTLTANTQPALMAVSMAVVRVLEKEFGIDLKDQRRCHAEGGSFRGRRHGCGYRRFFQGHQRIG